MNKQEVMMCRKAAQMYRELQLENADLRRQLCDRSATESKMNRADAEVINIVNSRGNRRPKKPTYAPDLKKPFDFETAEIVPGYESIIQSVEPTYGNKPRASYYVRLAMFAVIECVVWSANHVGAVNLLTAMAISIIVFLLANLHMV